MFKSLLNIFLFIMLSSKLYVSAFKMMSRNAPSMIGYRMQALRAMGTDVFIGNLPLSFSEDQLKEVIGQKASG